MKYHYYGNWPYTSTLKMERNNPHYCKKPVFYFIENYYDFCELLIENSIYDANN